MLPLSGIKVVELTTAVAGPYGGMILADLGADVIKVERPEFNDRKVGPEWKAAIFVAYNRNKKSVVIDLKSEVGKGIMFRLLGGCDIFLENLDPEVIESLGLSYDAVSKLNPRIIYCSIKGYGEGPYGMMPAIDPVIEAEAGLMYMTGETREGAPPCRPAGALVASSAGTFAVMAAIGAILNRNKTGKGDRIVVGMLESAVSLTQQSSVSYSIDKVVPGKWGSGAGPTGGLGRCFKSKDGWVYADGGNDRYWPQLCDALEISEKITIEDKNKNPQNTLRVMSEAVSKFTTAEAGKRIYEKMAMGAPVNTMKEIADDPHLKYTKNLVLLTLDPEVTLTPDRRAVPYIMLPIRSNDYNPSMAGWGGIPAPKLGEHTVEALRELGYTHDQITDILRQRIIS